MSETGRYQPATPGAVECPACGALACRLPTDMVVHMVGLHNVRCPACGQYWHELRVPHAAEYTRYWEPGETRSPFPAA